MANYFIIGGDGKEYGPVSEADVRQWIAEGRLNSQSMAKAESDAEFRSLGHFPEFVQALEVITPSPIAPLNSPHSAFATAPAMPYVERDYELEIGGCISRGFGLLKNNFATVFLGFLLVILVQMACGGVFSLVSMAFERVLLQSPIAVQGGFNYFASVVFAVVIGPLTGGLFMVYIKLIRNQPTSVGEVFDGFKKSFLPLFLGAAVVSLIVGACLLPFKIVWLAKAAPVLEQMRHIDGDPNAMQKILPQLASSFIGVLPLLVVGLLPTVYLQTCWLFTLPLIADKGMSFGTAMATSWKQVNRHWWQVFGLSLLAGLVTMAGLLGCCVGILFTAPIATAALMYGYETIFSGQDR